MGWRDLLQERHLMLLAPWLGGRVLHTYTGSWRIKGALPEAHGWHTWAALGREATWTGVVPGEEIPSLKYSLNSFGTNAEGKQVVNVHSKRRLGYLVGDLFVSDEEGGSVQSPEEMKARFERVQLIELFDQLDHFARVVCCRFWEGGPLIFCGDDFPVGSEDAVRDAFLERLESVDHIPSVSPALNLAFRMKVLHRAEVEKRRAEEELRRVEREKRRAEEDRRRELREKLGDGASRREVALHDFETAARAALAVGGAAYLDHRKAPRKNEFIVRYRLDGRGFECVCDETLHIIDAGICLTDHETGEKGDTYFTLESLPGVTRQAMAAGAAIWRHV